MNGLRDRLEQRLTRKAPEWVEKYLSWVVGAVFAVAAIALYGLLVTIFANHYAARSWVATPVEVTAAEIKTSRSGSFNRPTFNSRIRTEYRYRFAGREYTGQRVDFGFGSDNFADTRRARQMELLERQSPVAFVDPARAEEAVIDRSLPVEQINFAILFLFFPCGLGTAMLLGAVTGLAARLGLEWPGRCFGPAFGLLHSLPAFYAPLFAPGELGPFGWFLVVLAAVVLCFSLRSLFRNCLLHSTRTEFP